MHSSFRALPRALCNSFPFSRLRSFEERFGIAGFALMLLFAMSHPLWAHDFTLGDIEIDHPWSRASPAGAKVAAGYLVISNKGSTPDRLISATSDIAAKAEVHEMSVDANGVMTMRPLTDGLEIPAGGKVALEPGSYHMMFMGLKRGPQKGETFAGTLTFQNAGTIAIEYSVDAMGGGSNHDAHGG